MAKSTHSIEWRIGATLLQSSVSAFNKTTSAIKKINKEMAKVESAKKAAQALSLFENRAKALTDKANKLKQELNKFSGASAETATKQKELANALNKVNSQMATNTARVNKAKKALQGLGVEAKSAAQAQDVLNKKMRQLQVDQASSAFNRNIKDWKSSGRERTASGFMQFGAGAGALYSGVNFFKKAASLESTLAHIRVQNDEKGFNEKALKDLIMELSVNSTISAKTISELSLDLQKAGFGYKLQTGKEQFLKTMVDLTMGSGEEAATVMGVMSQTYASFGEHMSENNISMRGAMNMVQQAANDSMISIGNIGQSMKYLGPTMGLLGARLDDALSFITIAGKSGLKGGDATRAFKSAVGRLAKPTRAMRDTIAEFANKTTGTGIEFDIWDEKGNFKGMYEMLNLAAQIQEVVSPEDYQRFVKDVFGSEAMTTILAITKKGTESMREFREEREKLAKAAETDLIGRQAEEQLKTVEGMFLQLRNKFDRLAVTAFVDGKAGESLKIIITSVGDLVDGLNDLIIKFPLLGWAIPWITLVGGGLLMVSGIFNMIVGTISTAGAGIVGLIGLILGVGTAGTAAGAEVAAGVGTAVTAVEGGVAATSAASLWKPLLARLASIRAAAVTMWASISGPVGWAILGTAAAGFGLWKLYEWSQARGTSTDRARAAAGGTPIDQTMSSLLGPDNVKYSAADALRGKTAPAMPTPYIAPMPVGQGTVINSNDTWHISITSSTDNYEELMDQVKREVEKRKPKGVPYVVPEGVSFSKRGSMF